MIPRRRQILLNAFKGCDLLIMAVSFLAATSAVFYRTGADSFVDFLSMRLKVENFVIFIAFLTLWHIIFSYFDMYKSRRLSTQGGEIIDVVRAISRGTLAIVILAIAFRIHVVTPVFLAIFWVVSIITTISGRVILRFVSAQMRLRGHNVRNLLIAGTNPRALGFARKIEAKPERGYHLVGFVDDEWPGMEQWRKTGYPLIGNLRGVSDILRDRVIDEVVIALPVKSFYAQSSQIVEQCEEQGIIVRFPSEIFNPRLARSKPEEFQDSSMMSLYTGAMHGWSVGIKRTLDFCLSLVALVVCAPVFVATAVLIRMTSPGPIFFVQERVGLNKRRFRLYKFRTMVPDAEEKLAGLEHLNEVSGPVFKIKEDPRLTPIGKFLRRTSIDELPQLWNVLKGDMSLVGPRPLPVRDYNGFDQDWQRRRFSVRPGITCLWQVNGRSDLSFDKWMEMDMQYIDQWSLWLDMKILAQTVPAVVKGSGAA